MNIGANTKRIGAVALATVIAAVAIPVAAASGATNDPGLVARKLGSPDPRENATKVQYAPGIVASRLGTSDPRDSALPSITASAVARTFGSPDPRDSAIQGVPAELRGPVRPDGPALRATFNELASQASRASSAVATELGSPDPQDAAVVAQNTMPPSADGFDWVDFGIGLGFGIGLSGILAGSIVLAAVALRGRTVAQPLV
jgi:hypothetical protein